MKRSKIAWDVHKSSVLGPIGLYKPSEMFLWISAKKRFVNNKILANFVELIGTLFEYSLRSERTEQIVL